MFLGVLRCCYGGDVPGIRSPILSRDLQRPDEEIVLTIDRDRQHVRYKFRLQVAPELEITRKTSSRSSSSVSNGV